MSTPLLIRHYPDPILKKQTQPITSFDAEFRKTVGAMMDLMNSLPHCVGIAAPQVGLCQRFSVIDAGRIPGKKGSAHGALALINPVVLQRSGQMTIREGCLSVPDYTGDVVRSAELQVRAQTLSGEWMIYEVSGFEAVVFQHEMDHLDGFLFLDRVADVHTDVFRRKKYL